MTRNEVVELMAMNQESESLIKRLTQHFPKDKYEFSLSRQSSAADSGTLEVAELLQPPTLLICFGTSDVEDAIRVQGEIRQVLSPEELEQLEFMFEIQDQGYLMRGSQLYSERK